MAYYGNQPIAGETNSFKVLDDISSYTKTFDGSSAAVVSTSDDTLTFYDHRFIQGQRVTYGKGSGGTVITGLTDATVYYVIRQDKDTIQLATSASNAAALTAVNITAVAPGGTVHELTVAFDGTNTKFKATTGGIHIKLTRPGQLMISMNGVVQEPQNNTPSNGFGIESNNVIVFSTAPTVLDTFWGHYLTSNLSSWEMSDNKIDNFTGNGSTTTYTLSKTPANADNILVTIDGVTQYPSDSATTRAYTLNASVVTFTTAPTINAEIAVRHIGYAGGSGGGGGGVTGFYGRTGNVSMIRSDLQNTDINLKNLTGVAATFTGNVSIGGTLTYTDVTNIDSIGIVTAQSGVHFGIGATSGKFEAATGITTFSTSVGIADSIHHVGNTDTSIRFPSDDTFTVETAGSERLRIDSNGTSNFTGQVKVSDGTTSAPSVAAASDTNSGLYFPGADAVGLVAGGSRKLLANSSGITINNGDLAVNGGNLDVTGDIRHIDNTNTKIAFTSNTISFDTAAAERLRINSSGDVGIGTDPARRLSIFDTDATVLELNSTNSGGTSLRIQNNHTDKMYMGLAGDFITGQGSNVTDSAIRASGALLFASGGGTEVLRISSGGKIGINDTNPERTMDVRGSNCMIQLEGTGGNGRQYSLCSTDDTTGAAVGPAGQFVIYDDTSGADRFSITSAGNIGIARTDPDQRLNVNGNIEVNAYDSANGSGGYYTAKGLIIGNAYDAGITGLTDDRNGIMWQERGLDLDFATNNTFRMKITYDGNIGINTTLAGSQTWRNGKRLEIFGGEGNVTGELHLGAKRSDANQSVGSINFFDNGQDSTHRHIALIEADKAGSTSNKRGGDLIFFTKKDNVAAPDEKLRITSKGTTIAYQGAAPSDALTYPSAFRSREGVIGPIYYWPRSYASHSNGGGYDDVAEGGRLTLRLVGATGGTAAMFHGGFGVTYGGGGEAIEYNRVRVIFRASRANTTDGYSQNTITFKMQQYYYSGGWTDISNSAWDFDGTDSERGYRWTASHWVSSADFAGGFDVPSIAIKYDNDNGNLGNANIRIAAVYLQYARFSS